MQLATKTLAAIEKTMAADQGATYRGLLRNLMLKAEDAFSTDNTPFRNHLGASLIGRECSRELWYSFRWCLLKRFDGRMLRLFNSGHLMEPKIVASLELIGCKVYQFDEQGKQFRISGFMGHFGGSLDAVAIGIPDLPENAAALCEFKSHGEKSFVKLKADGLVTAKFEHSIQMQLYMNHYKLEYGLYVAQNKNTDEIYAEIIQRDEIIAKKYSDRSAMIITATEPPPKISNTPGFFKCRFCDFQQLCHLSEIPAVNCRTCVSSRVIDDGKWYCSALLKDLTSAEQRAGCGEYDLNPAIKA